MGKLCLYRKVRPSSQNMQKNTAFTWRSQGGRFHVDRCITMHRTLRKCQNIYACGCISISNRPISIANRIISIKNDLPGYLTWMQKVLFTFGYTNIGQAYPIGRLSSHNQSKVCKRSRRNFGPCKGLGLDYDKLLASSSWKQPLELYFEKIFDSLSNCRWSRARRSLLPKLRFCSIRERIPPLGPIQKTFYL